MTGWFGLVLVAAAMMASGRPAAAADEPLRVSGTGPAAGAEAYYQWLTGCLDAIEKDLPKFTRSAEAAARLYVDGGSEIGAYGGDPFVLELFGRSGGVMRMLAFDKFANRKEAPSLPDKAIALVGLREDRIDEIVGKITEFRKKGYHVVVFGRADLVDKARKAHADVEVDTHAAPHGGLLQDANGRWIIPTDSAAASAASWTWVSEFVAACTRLGKMPPMYLGYAVEGAMEREARFKGLKFHDKLASRLDAGQLSKQFLSELRRSLEAIHDLELPRIRQTAAEALKTRSSGGKLWVYLQGHEILRLMGYPNDPQWFEPIHQGWNTMRQDVKIGPSDFILCIGFDQIFQGERWEGFAERTRKAGAKIAWSITDYRPEEVKAIPSGEVFINQHWAKGDAVAEVPKYDIKCIPTSGVIAEAVLWMVHAEMLKQQGDAASRRPATTH